MKDLRPEVLQQIDGVQSKPEKWPNDGDYLMPQFVVAVFFLKEEDAKAFIEAAS